MKKIGLMSVVFVFFSLIPANALGASMEKYIKLNKVDYSKGKTLMQSLRDRQSSRDFIDKELSIEILSELLWSAGGITREDGRKTFPTAMNSLEVDIYVFMKSGIYLYEPQANRLKLVEKSDKRADTGMQDFVSKASVNLVYVSNLSKMKGGNQEQKTIMAAVDAGHISQSVYLYCASADLGCVIRGSVDSPKILKILKLNSKDNVVFLSQSVGYTK